MSLDREDVRCRLSPEHAHALKAICDVRGMTIAEYVEALLVADIEDRVHDAHAIASVIPRMGKTATTCDSAERKAK